MIATALLTFMLASGPTAPGLPTSSIRNAVSSAALAHRIASKVELTVNVADGSTLSGDAVFSVKVSSDHPVSQVEFYVGDSIRDTDDSTPYEFKIDTISENDGPFKVTFAAYDANGASAKKTLNLTIDNGMSKGVDFHVNEGKSHLANSAWDKAITSGRIALKINNKSNGARLVLARANYGKGVYDSAQKFAEDALADDPKLFEAADLLSAINLERAFNTFNRSTERIETLNLIKNAMAQAVQNRRKVLDNAVDNFGSVTDANRLAYADAAIKAGRYSNAISVLAEQFKKDSSDPAVINRLVYAQIRAGRMEDAVTVLTAAKRSNALDAYTLALWSTLEALKGKDQESDDLMKEAILLEPDHIGVQTAQAWIALKRNRMDALRNVAARLGKDQGQRSEVQYYLAALYHGTGNFVEGRKAFERSVLAEPANYDMYVQRGNESLALVAAQRTEAKENDYNVQVAKAFYETALVARAESAEALTGLALINMFTKNVNSAVKLGSAAVGAAPSYAAGHYVYSMVLSTAEADTRARAERIRDGVRGTMSAETRNEINGLLKQANEFGKQAMSEMKLAEQADAVHLGGRGIPRLTEAYTYFARHGKLPLLAAPK